jgi:hypothetical protein
VRFSVAHRTNNATLGAKHGNRSQHTPYQPGLRYLSQHHGKRIGLLIPFRTAANAVSVRGVQRRPKPHHQFGVAAQTFHGRITSIPLPIGAVEMLGKGR